MFIITGGFISMTTDKEPTPMGLATGSVVGGTIGAVIASASSLTSSFDSGHLFDSVTSTIDALVPNSDNEMKVGLPNF
jgi:hypothetical protein